MSDTEFRLWDDIDKYEEEQENPQPLNPTVKCKGCGTAGLHWEQFAGHWRLVNKHNLVHKCVHQPLRGL